MKKVIIVYWAHEVINNFKYTFIYKNVNLLLGTNTAIINDIIKNIKKNVNYEITYNPISKDILKFNEDKITIRRNLNLPLNDIIIGYTGKLYIGQLEIEYLLKAAQNLPEYKFLFTGGKPEVLKYYKEYCKAQDINNVIFVGFLYKYLDVIKYQRACDVLVSYYTSQDHFTKYNLPQKILEYMASGNPIVTPDYPATKDVLNERNCIFVEPENLSSLILGIKQAVENKDSKKLAKKALSDVKQITFKNITKNIIKKINDEF